MSGEGGGDDQKGFFFFLSIQQYGKVGWPNIMQIRDTKNGRRIEGMEGGNQHTHPQHRATASKNDYMTNS